MQRFPIPPLRGPAKATAPAAAPAAQAAGPALPPLRLRDGQTAAELKAAPAAKETAPPPAQAKAAPAAKETAPPPAQAKAAPAAKETAPPAVAQAAGPALPPLRLRDGRPASEVAAPPAEKPPEPPEKTAQAPPPAPQKPGDLSFDLLGAQHPAPSPATDLRLRLGIERQVKVRRALLQAHQAFGFATLGVMAATLVIGQLSYIDNFTSGDFSGRYDNAHLGLGIATTALFATTGILALAAPNPYKKPVRFDSATVHKAAMALATAGMVAQVILGPIITARDGKLDQPNLALAHLITGYATFGFMATGVFAYVF